MVVPSTLRADIIYRFNDVEWQQNVVHFHRPALGVTQATADELAAVLGDAWTDSLMYNYMADNTQLRRVIVKDLSFTNAPEFEAQIAENGAGGNPGAQLLALAIQLYTGIGSSGNGRVFQGGYAAIAQAANNGRPSGPVISTTLDFWDQVLQASDTASNFGRMVVVHRGSSDTSDVVTVRRTVSSSGLGWQTQRRRRDGLDLS